MLCHLGPEQTDHTINVNARPDPDGHRVRVPELPAADRGRMLAEPTGPFRAGHRASALARRSRRTPRTPWRSRTATSRSSTIPRPRGTTAQVAQSRPASPSRTTASTTSACGPTAEDIGRGGDDAFGWPLSLAALALKNIGGPDFEPCDGRGRRATGLHGCRTSIRLGLGGGLFEETGDGASTRARPHLQSINPGSRAMAPVEPLLPEYMAPWINNLPGRRAAPADRRAGRLRPNTITAPAVRSSSARSCSAPTSTAAPTIPDPFGVGPPNFGWGPRLPEQPDRRPEQLRSPAQRHVARSQPRGAERRVQGAAAAQRRAHRAVLPHRQLPDPAPGGRLLHARRRLPGHQREDRDPNLVDVDVQAFGFGTTNAIANCRPVLGWRAGRHHPATGSCLSTTAAHPPVARAGGGEDRPVKFLSGADGPAGEVRAGAVRPAGAVHARGRPGSGQHRRPVHAAAQQHGNPKAVQSADSARCRPSAPRATRRRWPASWAVTNNPDADCTTEISHFCR